MFSDTKVNRMKITQNVVTIIMVLMSIYVSRGVAQDINLNLNKRVVITFIDSKTSLKSLNTSLIPETEVVKQYGRRLVLLIKNKEVTNEQIINHYGGEKNVLMIEEDKLINPNLVTGYGDFVDSFTEESMRSYYDVEKIIRSMSGELVTNHSRPNDIYAQTYSKSWGLTGIDVFEYSKNPKTEWQFSSDSEFGMNIENTWQVTNGSSETRIAVLDSGIANFSLNNS